MYIIHIASSVVITSGSHTMEMNLIPFKVETFTIFSNKNPHSSKSSFKVDQMFRKELRMLYKAKKMCAINGSLI